MTKRVKPQLMTLNDLAAVDGALHDIAIEQIALRRIEADAEEQVQAIRKGAAAQAEVHQNRIKMIESAIRNYAESHKAEILPKGLKSVELNFGVIGFRLSTKICVKASTLGLLKKLGFVDGIRIREEVNKEVLADWDWQKLSLVDAKQKREDVFYYEVKDVEILDPKAGQAAS